MNGDDLLTEETPDTPRQDDPLADALLTTEECPVCHGHGSISAKTYRKLKRGNLIAKRVKPVTGADATARHLDDVYIRCPECGTGTPLKTLIDGGACKHCHQDLALILASDTQRVEVGV